MKKIGILTFHYSNNFGAVLQTYALSKTLENLGFKPHVINFIPKGFEINFNEFEHFRNDFLNNVLEECRDFNSLAKLNSRLDCFVVGSDQVWRYNYTKSNYKRYFLDFVNNDRLKIAYAASFGIDRWEGPDESLKPVSELLKKFHSIGVREESGIKICQDVFGVQARCVLDPTFLLDKKYYEEIINSENRIKGEKKPYIAYMVLDDNDKIFKKVKSCFSPNIQIKRIKGNSLLQRLRMTLILKFLNLLEKNIANSFRYYIKKIINYKFKFNSVSNWLLDIKNSELIVTDSFHTVVFSILFRKKFYCIRNKERGESRLKSLLKKIDLDNRFIFEEDILTSFDLDHEINYESVNSKLATLIESSKSFLSEALSIGK